MSIQQETTNSPFALVSTGDQGILGQFSRSFADLAASAGRTILAGRRRRQTERQLASLSDAILKDIGLHRSEVSAIARSLAGDGQFHRGRGQ